MDVKASVTVTIKDRNDAKRIINMVADAQLAQSLGSECMNIMDMGGYGDYCPDLLELGRNPISIWELLRVVENWDVWNTTGNDLVERRHFLGDLMLLAAPK